MPSDLEEKSINPSAPTSSSSEDLAQAKEGSTDPGALEGPKPTDQIQSAADKEVDDLEDDANDQEPADLENRILCPDGTCIGVIGSNGLCKVCGAKYDSTSASEKSDEVLPALDALQDEQYDLDQGDHNDSDEEDEDFLKDRKLCSDGTCIGVIGPENTCKVCGKPYAGELDLNQDLP